jgi:threonine dehydrogenase-like Zn-dependent dehydrogenase
MDVAWRFLAEIDTAALITHRFDISEAQQAFELLDRHPERALQVLFSYGN